MANSRYFSILQSLVFEVADYRAWMMSLSAGFRVPTGGANATRNMALGENVVLGMPRWLVPIPKLLLGAY